MYKRQGEPKTWDEFIEICDKFMEKGIHPIACGNAANLSTQLGYQLLVSMIPDHSSDLFNEIVAGEAKMTDEPMATVSKLVKQVSDADYYCEGSTGLDKFGACEVFMRGEAPFLVEGSWRAITLAEDETLNWDVFSISAPGGAEDVYLFRPAQIHVINANTPHKDEALKYYEFMSRPESMEIFSSTTCLLYTSYLAAIQSIPNELEEGAIIDGASAFYYLRKIVLPMIKEVIVICIVLNVTGSLKAFDISWIMTWGGPGSASSYISTYMYKMAIKGSEFSYGITVAMTILIFSLIFTIVIKKIFKAESVEY